MESTWESGEDVHKIISPGIRSRMEVTVVMKPIGTMPVVSTREVLAD